jgi:hypothetical protein
LLLGANIPPARRGFDSDSCLRPMPFVKAVHQASEVTEYCRLLDRASPCLSQQ